MCTCGSDTRHKFQIDIRKIERGIAVMPLVLITFKILVKCIEHLLIADELGSSTDISIVSLCLQIGNDHFWSCDTNLGRVSYVFKDYRAFHASKLVIAPQREEIEPAFLGMNEFDYTRRGTHAIFPLLDCRSCENFGLAHLFHFLPSKKKLIKQSPHFDQLSVF